MTHISETDRNIFEQFIYLPMLLTILERDRLIIEKSPLKLNKPYLNLVEESIKAIQKELRQVKRHMWKNGMKVQQIGHDESFTNYLFVYRGYEEQHNFFNPHFKNKVNDLLEYFLYKRYLVNNS